MEFIVIFADVIELMSLSSETEFRLFGSGLKYTPEHRDAFKNQVWLLVLMDPMQLSIILTQVLFLTFNGMICSLKH